MKPIDRHLKYPAEWWSAFEAQARAEGMGLTEWIGERCRDRLPAKVRAALPERGKPGRPRLAATSTEVASASPTTRRKTAKPA